MTADPRTIEDLAEAGRRAMLRAVRDNAEARQRIEAAADWLLEHARKLRDGAPRC